jgi:hypothetical protein
VPSSDVRHGGSVVVASETPSWMESDSSAAATQLLEAVCTSFPPAASLLSNPKCTHHQPPCPWRVVHPLYPVNSRKCQRSRLLLDRLYLAVVVAILIPSPWRHATVDRRCQSTAAPCMQACMPSLADIPTVAVGWGGSLTHSLLLNAGGGGALAWSASSKRPARHGLQQML